jgi:hypothetical protein
MKTTVIALITLAAIVGLILFSVSGGLVNYDSERTFRVAVVSEDQELIKLIPAQPYAYIGEDGKLYVEITESNPNFPGYGSGLSPDTVYAFDCVFKVKNALWENQTIFFVVNSSTPSILVYSPDDTFVNSPETAAMNMVFPLQWKEDVCIGMVFNLSGTTEVGVKVNATI